MNLEKAGFISAVLLVLVILLLFLGNGMLYVLLFAGIAAGGWFVYDKYVKHGKKEKTSTMLGLPPLAKREKRRRQADICHDKELCREAPPTRYPPVGGVGGEEARNSIRNDVPDTCMVGCVEGMRQPTLPGGHFCGIEDDPNFTPFDARQNLEKGLDVSDDHYAADSQRALYQDAEQRIYNRDRNGLMMARRAMIGSTRPKKGWAEARKGFIQTVLGNYNVKDSRYMEVVDRRLVNTDFKERNFA